MRLLILPSLMAGLALSTLGSVMAHAADLPPMDAPPVDGLRPASYDWSGPYIGGYGSGVDTRSHFTPDCNCGGRRELNGWGYNGGLLAGWNYQIANFVLGVEGSWGWGGKAAIHREFSGKTRLRYKDVATARARLGWAFDDTMLYATGGYAAYRTKFETEGNSGDASKRKWRQGWLVGGGVEHAFTDRILARMEYTYTHLNKKTYDIDEGGVDVPIHSKIKGLHTMSVGMAYKFGW